MFPAFFLLCRLSGCHHLDNFEAMDSVVLSLEVIEGIQRSIVRGSCAHSLWEWQRATIVESRLVGVPHDQLAHTQALTSEPILRDMIIELVEEL